MRLLDRYQLREFLVALGYCLAGILVFWMSFELLGEIDELKRRDLGVLDALEYLGQRLPLNLLLQMPVALLLALLYALTQHARHNELIAMRAAGVSLWRMSAPYLGVGIVASVGMQALNEFVVPDAAARAEEVLERKTPENAASRKDWRENLVFVEQGSGRIWYLRGFNVATAELRGAHIQWRGTNGGREELMAERGQWNKQGWEFEDVTRFSFAAGTNAVNQSHTNRLIILDFPETPAHLRSEVKISRLLGSFKKSRQVQLSLREILNYRELHHQMTPQFDALLRTWFHDRLAAPWTCLVVVLVGIPAAAAPGRRNVFVSVAAAIFLAFAFFVLKEFSLAAASGGYLPAWLAAWLPNLAFGGMGLAAIQMMR